MSPLHWKEIPPASDGPVTGSVASGGIMPILGHFAFSMFLLGLIAGFLTGKLLYFPFAPIS